MITVVSDVPQGCSLLGTRSVSVNLDCLRHPVCVFAEPRQKTLDLETACQMLELLLSGRPHLSAFTRFLLVLYSLCLGSVSAWTICAKLFIWLVSGHCVRCARVVSRNRNAYLCAGTDRVQSYEYGPVDRLFAFL